MPVLRALAAFVRRRRRTLVGGALLLALAAGVTLAVRYYERSAPTTVLLDPKVRYQTIDGFAVYPRYWEDDKKNDRFDRSFEPVTGVVSDYLVNELGLNAVRVEIWSGLENPHDHWLEHYDGKTTYKQYADLRYEKINDNDDPRVANPAGFQFSKFDHRMTSMVLPLVRAIEKRGEKPFLTVCYVDFKWKAQTRQGTLSHAKNPEEFAEFVVVFFERLREKFGVVPESFELILEPENTESWRGQEIGRALVTVAARLKEKGFSPRFIAPSNTSMSNAIEYFDAMVEVPGAVDLLDTFAYHRYHLERTSYVEEIWRRARERGKKTAMLEKVGAGIDVLFEDLVVGNVSGWQQWAAADRLGTDNGGYYALVDDRDPAHPRVLPAATSPLLSQVFRYVRRGAVRVAATSDRADKAVVAFVNPGDRQTVVVRAKRAGGALTVRGLGAGRYGLRFVGNDRAVRELPPADVTNGELRTTIPDAGALAVYGLGAP
jgi:hypothetical protein